LRIHNRFNGGYTLIYGGDVLAMLIPTGGWAITGNDYEGIEFLECEPITKAQFEAGFAQYDAWKAEQVAKAANDKAALLAKLGITADEAKLLLS
jgi:hypothetical protein